MMTERPILFSTWSVQRILANAKTQTRRLVKPQLFQSLSPPKCPYGVPGDVLWVRETWAASLDTDGDMTTPIHYRATYDEDVHGPLKPTFNSRATEVWDTVGTTGWKPSIFMYRWMSRLNLVLEDVRIEPLQGISSDDCQSEGISGTTHPTPVRGQPYEVYHNGDGLEYTTPTLAFAALWNTLHSKPKKVKTNPYTSEREPCYVSYPWQDVREAREKNGLSWHVVGNPFVWKLAFSRK